MDLKKKEIELPTHRVYRGDNLDILINMIEDESVDLIYIDPPFNTGKKQIRQSETALTERPKTLSYPDDFPSMEEYISWLKRRVSEGWNKLKNTGSFFLHVDYRVSHYCKCMLDNVCGENNFMNEIIWAYDFGGRPTHRWSTKHDNIFWYVKDTAEYTFNFEKMERIPYMAPGLVGPLKAAMGKTPTDVWWHTIVPTNGNEKTGYPTQKPLGILNRIITIHSNPGDTIMDFFAGSGTTGESAAMHNRSSILIDQNPDAVDIIIKRMRFYGIELGFNPNDPCRVKEN